MATYHFPDAYQALQNVKDGTHLSIAGDGVVLVGTKYKNSVHLAYPKSD